MNPKYLSEAIWMRKAWWRKMLTSNFVCVLFCLFLFVKKKKSNLIPLFFRLWSFLPSMRKFYFASLHFWACLVIARTESLLPHFLGGRWNSPFFSPTDRTENPAKSYYWGEGFPCPEWGGLVETENPISTHARIFIRVKFWGNQNLTRYQMCLKFYIITHAKWYRVSLQVLVYVYYNLCISYYIDF